MDFQWDDSRSSPIEDLFNWQAQALAVVGTRPTTIHMSSRQKVAYERAVARDKMLRAMLADLPRYAHIRRYKLKRALGYKRWQSIPLPKRIKHAFFDIGMERHRKSYNRKYRNEPDFEYWEK